MNELTYMEAFEVSTECVGSESFLRDLERSGYGEFLTTFPPHLIGTHAWEAAREFVPENQKMLIDLLLLGRSVAYADVLKIIPSIDYVLENGTVIRSGNEVCIPTLALVYFGGLWLFVQRPKPNPTIYIGHDTFGLLARLRVREGERALDLCSGPGTQGLYMASRGANVTAVECNIVAAEVARLNCELNSLDSRFKVKIGNLYNALNDSDLPFDLISANPPLLPFPDDHFYPFVGHGGADGLSVTWRILNGLPRWLSPKGRAQIIGTCFSDGYLPCALSDFQKVANLCQIDIIISIVGHSPFSRGSVTFEGLAYTAAFGTTAAKLASIKDGLEQIALSVGATDLCYFSLHAQRGTGQVDVIDLSSEHRPTLWFS